MHKEKAVAFIFYCIFASFFLRGSKSAGEFLSLIFILFLLAYSSFPLWLSNRLLPAGYALFICLMVAFLLLVAWSINSDTSGPDGFGIALALFVFLAICVISTILRGAHVAIKELVHNIKNKKRS